MKRWVIRETCEYRIDADSAEEAERLYLEHGPGNVEKPVAFVGAVERTVEEAPPLPERQIPVRMPGDGALYLPVSESSDASLDEAERQVRAWPARLSPFGGSA